MKLTRLTIPRCRKSEYGSWLLELRAGASFAVQHGVQCRLRVGREHQWQLQQRPQDEPEPGRGRSRPGDVKTLNLNLVAAPIGRPVQSHAKI